MLTQPFRRRSPRRPAPPGRVPSLPRRSGANDNRRHRVRVPPNPGRLARLGANVLRLNPYFRLAGMGLNVLDIWSQPQAGGVAGYDTAALDALPGWSVFNDCSRPAIRLNENYPANSCGFVTGDANYWANGWDEIRQVLSYRQRAIFVDSAETYQHLPQPSLRGAIVLQAGSIFNPKSAASAAADIASVAIAAPSVPAYALPPNQPDMWPVTMDPALARPGEAPAFTAPVPLRYNKYWQAPNRVARYHPSERLRTWSGNEVINDWSVSIGNEPSAPPRTHRLAKALNPARKPHEIEKKARLTPGQALTLKAVSEVTEALDFINAIYDALPEQYRPRWKETEYEKLSVDPVEKLRAIVQNGDHLDVAQAVQNLIWENIEDFFYGQIGKFGAETSRILGRPYGTGLNTVNRRFFEYNRDQEDRVDGEQ